MYDPTSAVAHLKEKNIAQNYGMYSIVNAMMSSKPC